MTETFDILIIGAGIVGTACALELAQVGLSVCLIERDTVGGGATAAGMGHIVVMDDSPAQLLLTRYSQTLWDTLVQSDPQPYGYTRCGTIWIAADIEEMQEVAHKHALYREYEVDSEILDSHQLYALEPRLHPGLAGGLLVPGDSVVYPPSCAALLLAQASQYNTTLINGNVCELLPNGVKLQNGQTIQAAAIVLASGAHASELLPDLPLRPKKGHLAITDRYPGFIHHQLIELGYIKNAHASSG
ncbi:MAG TPA: FAD-dependent oxidoreductase, partial [Ktedonobacteraceae bacterium]|nr:FAD-dependent oxidoreductase [Ktedonobacteraceae bacterium]